LAKQKGATEEQIAGVRDFRRAPFTDREKLGFECADRLHESPESVDDKFYERLEKAFNREEIIELFASAAAFEFFTRFVDALQIPVTPLPAAFRDLPRLLDRKS
jgi:alkylhydroperoxidase family enzyme